MFYCLLANKPIFIRKQLTKGNIVIHQTSNNTAGKIYTRGEFFMPPAPSGAATVSVGFAAARALSTSASARPASLATSSPTSMAPRGRELVASCKQWKIYVENRKDDLEVSSYCIENKVNGAREFYDVHSGKYGQPLVRAEPDRAMTLPTNISCVHAITGEPVELKEKIAGIILKDEPEGKLIGRYSLTAAANQNIELNMNEQGVLTVNGEDFELYALACKDKNRIDGLDAFFRKKVDSQEPLPIPIVKYKELPDFF
jgi:hypothetical protein